jgi:hypothetical protein
MPSDQISPPSNTKAGWRINEFAAATGLSRNGVYNLLNAKILQSVKVGDARIILTSPQEFLEKQRAP